MYTYIYMYIYVYIYTYIYMYIYVCVHIHYVLPEAQASGTITFKNYYYYNIRNIFFLKKNKKNIILL